MFSNALLISLTRYVTFFFLSPALSGLPLPSLAKGALSSSLALFSYAMIFQESTVPLWVALPIEIVFAYLLGTLFSLLMEAITVAGHLLGGMWGFSLGELLTKQKAEPSSSPLVLFAAALFFFLDMHLLLVKGLVTTPSTLNLVQQMPQSLHFSYTQGFLMTAEGLFLFVLFVFVLSLSSKWFPSSPIFWTFLPMQLLCGILSILYLLVRLPYHLKILLNVLFLQNS